MSILRDYLSQKWSSSSCFAEVLFGFLVAISTDSVVAYLLAFCSDADEITVDGAVLPKLCCDTASMYIFRDLVTLVCTDGAGVYS